MPVGSPVIVEPGTRVLRPAGLSSAERISDSLRVWGLRGLDATTPVAVRTSHSWEQINGFVTQRADEASSAQCLSFMRPNSVRKFIAPSLPFQGDQAVDAHAARAPAPPYSGGRVWSIILNVFRGAMTGRYLASGGG